MKRLSLIFLVISFISCDHFRAVTTGNQTVDSATLNKNINNVFDSMHMQFKAKNVNAMLNYLADDGKYLGTDPTEIWTKKALGDYLSKASSDTAKIDYTISSRTIQTDDDWKSAIVVEQYYFPSMSTKIQVRSIARVDFKDNRWIIDFYSWNLIPKNEDINKLNAALN